MAQYQCQREGCDNTFISKPSRNKKYCSEECFHITTRRKVEDTCDYCGKVVSKRKNARNLSRSGLIFCDRVCKGEAQASRESKFKAIIPAHYYATSLDYRNIAFRSKEKKCERCGYEDHPEIIVVHHIDRNRENNAIANLEALCPNCHAIEHYVSGALTNN